MERKEININEAYKNLFSSYEIKPRKNHWNKVRKKVAVKQFFQFRYNKLNIFYSILVPVTFIFSVMYVSKLQADRENKSSIEKKIILIEKPTKENTIPEIKNQRPEVGSKQLIPNNSQKDSITTLKAYIKGIKVDSIKEATAVSADSAVLCQKPAKKEKKVRIVHRTIEHRDTVFEIRQRDENTGNR